MSEVLDPSLVQRAQDALGRHAWREAFELLSAADADGSLSPAELELLAQAAWWTGQLPVSIEARERAYAAAVKSGDTAAAVLAAINLGHDNLLRNAQSVATGWLNRAEELLRGVEESPGHGWLAATRAFQASLVGQLDEALAQAARAHDIAARFGDRDLAAIALSCRGVGLVHKGQVDEGLAVLEQATASAVAGELEPGTAGGVCCATLAACASLGDWRRASEWTEAQDRWCRRENINGYPGMCRLYRSEIKRLRGSWLEAEAEARQASEELHGFIPAAVGQALYQVGEIRLRRGDLPAAEEALLRAHAYGREPEPALSLLRLAQGSVAQARDSIARILREPTSQPNWLAPPSSDLNRLAMLPAQVEIALAAGDLQAGRAAADEISALAERYPSDSVRAIAATALGAVLVREGDSGGGESALRRAVELWNGIDAPYEAARARILLAEAHAAAEAPERAILEAQAARASFERVGALPDVRRAEALLARLKGPPGDRPPETIPARIRRTFVFTDIVESTRLAEILGDAAWSELIRWHDQALRSIVAAHGGEEIKATGDGFFLAFDDPDRAIECAIAIQRRLAEHRQSQGFAPAVRIGVHEAEATRSGLDYIGGGVNLAARVAAQANGGEILVSASTSTSARREFMEGARRSAALKGISMPVELVPVDWR